MRVRVAFLVFAAVVGVLLGKTYIARMPSHDGFFLVPVGDEVRTAPMVWAIGTLLAMLAQSLCTAASASRSKPFVFGP